MNPNVYNTEAMKAHLLFGLLNGPAKAWAMKFVPEFWVKDFKFNDFFTRFKALYGTHDFGRQAFRQLQGLYQGLSSVADYVTHFQTLALQTKLSDFNQQNRFFDNLNQKVKTIVAGYPKERKQILEALINAASEAKDLLRSIGKWKDSWRKPQYQPNQGTVANPITINAVSSPFTPSSLSRPPPQQKYGAMLQLLRIWTLCIYMHKPKKATTTSAAHPTLQSHQNPGKHNYPSCCYLIVPHRRSQCIQYNYIGSSTDD
jgi:hypothetical protein